MLVQDDLPIPKPFQSLPKPTFLLSSETQTNQAFLKGAHYSLKWVRTKVKSSVPCFASTLYLGRTSICVSPEA